MLAYQIQKMAFKKLVLLFETMPYMFKNKQKKIINISHSSLEIKKLTFC